MNALLQGRVAKGHHLASMTVESLDAVMRVECSAYPFPWTRGNFIDSLAAGYAAQLLFDTQHQLLGYFVGMEGVEEMHLLNLTVEPRHQGQGHASTLFQALLAHSLAIGAHKLWLEVRNSNLHAQQVYGHFGFQPVGARKAYYSAPLGQREDAVVMALALAPTGRDQP